MNAYTLQFLVILLIALLFVLFIGDPDLHDALLKLVNSKAGG